MANKQKLYLDYIGRDKTGPATKSATANLGALKAASNGLVAAMAPLAGAATLGGLAVMIKGQLDAADKVQKLSLQLGVSTEALSQYRHVAELTGTSFESVSKGIRYMQKNMSDAEDGLSTAKRAFSDLNLEVHVLRQMEPDKAFELIGQALSEVADASKRTQLAMNIFGRAGAELIQTFSGGAAAVRLMREEADALGLTLSQGAADAAAAANDSLTRLKNTLGGLGQTIAISTAPNLEKFFTALQKIVQQPTLEQFADMGFEEAQEEIARLSAAALAFPAPFTGMTEAMAVGSARVHQFGADVGKLPPKVTEAATVTRDLVTSIDFLNGQMAEEGLFGSQFLADLDNYVNGLEEVKQAASQSMTILGDAAYDASRRMADSIAAAVFESENLLQGLGNVARSVFGSILSGFLTLGIQAAFPFIPGIGGVAGQLVPAGASIGKVNAITGKSAGGDKGMTIGSLNVNVAGMITDDPVSRRRVAEDLYTELQKVGSHHG